MDAGQPERCPAEDVLEALATNRPVDGPFGEHLASCSTCQAAVDEIRENNAFLATMVPKLKRTAKTPIGPLPGPEVIPGFRIESEISRGGQGVVYRAVQTATKRQVALKVLLSGALATSRQRHRFEREIELAASLRHPNIVTVYESGVTTDGWRYLAMELIDGVPVDQFLRLRFADRSLRNQRDRVPETLRQFAKIADAVNFAHQRGIMHRDLKPANMLVGRDGEPKVLDFGLARPLYDAGDEERGFVTKTGEFQGTLAYASPEQVKGDPHAVDTRTDVYSLGVILYECLTGQTPYPVVGSMSDVLRNIIETEPQKPSSLRRSIDDEVATIVLKCLAKEGDRRYQNAGELARDIRHYLAGEPIDARGDSMGYLLRKYMQRHRLNFAFACTLLAVLVAGLIISLTFWRQALAAQTGLERALERAEQRETDIRQVADAQAKMLSIVDPLVMGARLREDIFAEARAAMQRSGADAEQLVAHREQLESLLAGTNFTNAGRRSIDRNVLAPALAAIDRDFADQPLVQAMLWQSIASAYYRLGLYDEALPPAEQALQTRRRILGDDHPDTLESLSSMGSLLYEWGTADDAEPYMREALEKRLIVLGDDHPDTLTSMVELAGLLKGRRKYSEAEPYFREALEKRRSVLGDDHPDTLQSISDMGSLLWSQGKLSEAERYKREALAKHRRVLGDDHPDTLILINDVGLLLHAQARLPEAEPTRFHLRHSLRPDAQVKLAEAESKLREALKGLRRVLGDEHPHTIYTIANMGSLLQDQGRLSEAEEFFAEAVRRARGTLPGNWLVGKYLMRHAQTLVAMERFEQAEVEMVEAQEILAAVMGTAHARTNVAITALAELYEAWHAAEPDQGYEAKAAEWRARLAEQQATSRPAGVGE